MLDRLGHPYRRRVLTYLSGVGSRDEDGFTPETVATEGDDLERLTTELHLPKLDAAGYVAWDDTTWTLRRGPRFPEVAPFPRPVSDHPDALPGGWS